MRIPFIYTGQAGWGLEAMDPQSEAHCTFAGALRYRIRQSEPTEDFRLPSNDYVLQRNQW